MPLFQNAAIQFLAAVLVLDLAIVPTTIASGIRLLSIHYILPVMSHFELEAAAA